LHASTIRVPIVLADGRSKSAIISNPVSLERIPGTLLAALRLDRSLLPDAAAHLEAPTTPSLSETMYPWTNFGWRALRAWESEGWKLVQGVTDRLYRVAEDPQEANDAASRFPEVAERMRRELREEWARREGLAYASVADTLSPADVDALRSLGYAAGSSSGSSDASVRAFRAEIDPESRIALVDRMNLAITLFEEGDAAEASVVLRELVEVDPNLRQAWEYLGRSELARGNAAGSRDAFRRALDLGPNPVDVWVDLARAERQLGDNKAERAALEAALAADPRSVPARQALSRLALEEGDPDRAVRFLKECVEIRPRSGALHASLAQVYESLGRSSDARVHWTRAEELDRGGPIGARARAALARIEEQGA
jgi:Flp pilus assembly protein TadD